MGASFKARMITAAICIPFVILLLLAPISIVTTVIMLASLIGLYEYYKAVGILNCKSLCALGYIAAVVISFGSGFTASVSIVLVYIYMMILAFIMLCDKNVGLKEITYLIFGLIYIPYFLSHIIYVRGLEFGSIFIWLVFIGAFLTDTSAYFAGCLLGKHKLCPKISPKKTIEGAIGGVVGAGIFFVIFGLIINKLLPQFLNGNQFNLWMLFFMGVITSGASQIGDLFASAIKRQFDIKDYGNLLPGHGGILDRCDSIIFVAPTIFILLNNMNLFI